MASALGGIGAIVTVIMLPRTLRKLRAETTKLQSEGEKTDAEAAQVLSNTALALLAPARAEIEELEKRLRAANSRASQLEVDLGKSQSRVHHLESEVQGLRNQVSEMSKEMTAIQDENARLRDGEP